MLNWGCPKLRWLGECRAFPGVQYLKPGTALEAAALLGFEDVYCTAGLVTCRVFDSYATPPGWDMGN